MAAVVAAFHCDGAWRWADEIAEITADAFGLDHVRVTLTVDLLKIETLMRTVLARDVAEITSDAILDIDVSLDVVVEIEIPPVGHAAYRSSNDVIYRSKSLLVEVVI